MLKYYRLILFIIFNFIIFSLTYSQRIQEYDSIYDLNYYKAYYSNDIQTSSFVIYKLYNGGGNVSRSGLYFISYNNLPHFNYKKSGYDRGHLVPAEDFANDRQKIKSTFYYINCVPQTVRLNRGNWKKYEGEIRKLSRRDSLIIICGGCDYNSINILVPKSCFKVVYSLKTKKCIYSLYFKNDNTGQVIYSKKLRQLFTFKKLQELYK